MTDDLISRSELRQRIIKDYRKEFFGSVLWNVLDDMPTIDAVPVVHGRREEIRNAYGELEGWLCKCGCESKTKSKYCPNCGAKMDGDAE